MPGPQFLWTRPGCARIQNLTPPVRCGGISASGTFVKHLLLLLLALFTLAGCERYSWRQKLTITVETPAGEVSASSVSEVRWAKHWLRFEGMGWSLDVTGEAVVLEVTPGRYLFAILRSEATTEYMGSVAPASIAGLERRVIDGALFDEVQDKRDRAAGVIAVPEYQYPIMVTFGDIADPKSVALVDPTDLAASFGPGVRLKAVTLEVTEEPVTVGVVEGLIGWLGPYQEPALGPTTSGTSDVPFYRLVHMGDFLRRAK